MILIFWERIIALIAISALIAFGIAGEDPLRFTCVFIGVILAILVGSGMIGE